MRWSYTKWRPEREFLFQCVWSHRKLWITPSRMTQFHAWCKYSIQRLLKSPKAKLIWKKFHYLLVIYLLWKQIDLFSLYQKLNNTSKKLLCISNGLELGSQTQVSLRDTWGCVIYQWFAILWFLPNCRVFCSNFVGRA